MGQANTTPTSNSEKGQHGHEHVQSATTKHLIAHFNNNNNHPQSSTSSSSSSSSSKNKNSKRRSWNLFRRPSPSLVLGALLCLFLASGGGIALAVVLIVQQSGGVGAGIGAGTGRREGEGEEDPLSCLARDLVLFAGAMTTLSGCVRSIDIANSGSKSNSSGSGGGSKRNSGDGGGGSSGASNGSLATSTTATTAARLPPHIRGNYLHASALIVARLSIVVWVAALVLSAVVISRTRAAADSSEFDGGGGAGRKVGPVQVLGLLVCIAALIPFLIISATIEAHPAPFATTGLTKPSFLTCRVSAFADDLEAGGGAETDSDHLLSLSVSRRASLERAHKQYHEHQHKVSTKNDDVLTLATLEIFRQGVAKKKKEEGEKEKEKLPSPPEPSYNPGGWRSEWNDDDEQQAGAPRRTTVSEPESETEVRILVTDGEKSSDNGSKNNSVAAAPTSTQVMAAISSSCYSNSAYTASQQMAASSPSSSSSAMAPPPAPLKTPKRELVVIDASEADQHDREKPSHHNLTTTAPNHNVNVSVNLNQNDNDNDNPNLNPNSNFRPMPAPSTSIASGERRSGLSTVRYAERPDVAVRQPLRVFLPAPTPVYAPVSIPVSAPAPTPAPLYAPILTQAPASGFSGSGNNTQPDRRVPDYSDVTGGTSSNYRNHRATTTSEYEPYSYGNRFDYGYSSMKPYVDSAMVAGATTTGTTTAASENDAVAATAAFNILRNAQKAQRRRQQQQHEEAVVGLGILERARAQGQEERRVYEEGEYRNHICSSAISKMEDSTNSQNDEITEVLQRQLTDKQLSRSMSGQDVGNNYLFEVVLRRQPSVIDANPTDTSEPQPQGSTRSSAPPPPPPPQEKRVVKIGVTRGPERVRLRQIQNTCGHALVEQQDDPEHEPIALYFKAEKLIHAELRNFAHGFDCRRCDRWHGEYFDVDAAAAREVVQRWRRFCQLRPYGSDGCLRPFWACRLRGWRKRWGGRGGVDNDDDDDDGNDDDDDRGDDGDEEEEREKKWRRLRRRMRHWDRFANPTRLEFLWYDLTAPLDGLWRWRWHAIALLEGFAVAVLAFPSFPALLWFGVVVLLIFAETIRLEAPVTISAVWKTVEDFVNKLLS
ncbi:hypothetical protein UCREL1_3627 [Eutypa lata UCREL1]|uniref:Bacteriophage T5 Orf172 DNA-binding domain-containing protein n=1 Tax=Eutypa lata (strain UCR-EL1) TaxID=1287681 RepID=M7SYF7_EUTLA|nr:hypothetical protein UCREL1_3627 [Eutypa lata UCREL1]